jgi:hypothetical protein
VKTTITTSLSLLAVACAPVAAELFPPPAIPAAPTAADWPDAGAAVLDDVATISYRVLPGDTETPPRLVAVVDHRRRLKILDEKGLAEARVALPVDGFSTVTWVRARAVDPDGDIHTFSPETARVVARGDPIPDSDEVRSLAFTVPHVVVGGLVEVRYERVYLDPDFVPVWVFGGPLPVTRAELGLVVDEGVKVDFRYGIGEAIENRLPMRRKLADGKERLFWVERDLPAFHPEPRMAHLGRVSPWLVLVVTSARVGKERRRLETWQHVVDKVTALQERVGGKATTGKPEERFRKVRGLLRSVRIDGLGVRQPMAAAGLLRGEPACSRDAAAYLLNAMAGAGAKLFPAFLTGPTGPVLVDDFPGLYPFVAAGAAFDVADQNARDPTCREDPVRRGLLCTVPPDSYAFLDPLCRHCRYGELPTELTGGKALVVLAEGLKWVRVPEDPPERNRSMSQYRLVLDVDGSVKGAMSAELSGAPQRALRAALTEADEADARDTTITRSITGAESALALQKAELLDTSGSDPILRYKAEVVSRVEKLAVEHFRIRPVDLAGPALPGRWRQSRRLPAVMEAPAWVETAVAIDLPVGYSASLPETVTLIEPFAEYAAGYVRRDQTLSFTRRLVLKQHIIPVEVWPAFRRFLDGIEAMESAGVEVRSGEG